MDKAFTVVHARSHTLTKHAEGKLRHPEPFYLVKNVTGEYTLAV